MSAPQSPPYVALIGNVPKSVKESQMALKVAEHCGKTSFEHLTEYGPKQPCYSDVAKTTDPVSNYWFVVEFENPNSLKTCLEMDGTDYKDHKLKVRILTSKEYDEICGLFDIIKARTKRIKKDMKGKRLTIVLASNVSSRVTSDALYKFFSFPGDPIEVSMDRARKIALIAYDSEEQAVIALACDQAILGPAMIRIELYRPEKHGRDLQYLLKVGHTGEIAHVGAQSGYVQVTERAHTPADPVGQTIQKPVGPSPPSAPSAAQGPKYPAGYPPGYQPSAGPAHHHIATHYNPRSQPTAPPASSAYARDPAHGNSSNPFSLGGGPSPNAPSIAAPSAHVALTPSPNHASPTGNPYSNNSSPINPYSAPKADYHLQPPSGRPEPSNQDWSKIVPTANYTVTTEVQK